MIESFLTAFIVYFVVIDPVGTAPIFLAVTGHLDRAARIRTAIEATLIATLIMLFFALCGSWVLQYLKIGQPAFKIAGGIILFLVAWDMLNSKRQRRKPLETTGDDRSADHGKPAQKSAVEPVDTSTEEADSVAIFPLAIPMLAGPAAIMSVMVVSADFGDSMSQSVIGYTALLSVMIVTGCVLALTGYAERWIDPRLGNVFSRVTAIILAALSVQYIVDGLAMLGIVTGAS